MKNRITLLFLLPLLAVGQSLPQPSRDPGYGKDVRRAMDKWQGFYHRPFYKKPTGLTASNLVINASWRSITNAQAATNFIAEVDAALRTLKQ
jgi:hypothetical protein